MTTENMGQAVPITQTAPDMAAQAPQPPAQPGVGQGQGGSHSCAPPSAAPACWANIPGELRVLKQWCLASADKRPLTVEGHPASSTDPATWTDFDSVASVAAQQGLRIGFMLTASDPFACIDLDVKDQTPESHLRRHEQIIGSFDSYTERSLSGRGFHIFVRGKIGKGRRRDGVEVYSQDRFMICTGDVTRPRPIEARPELLAVLAQEMPAVQADALEVWGDNSVDWSAATLAAQDQGELGRLFGGDWEGRYPSQSEADLALVKLLMPLCDSPRECWLTFRQSVLGRREKAARPDYAASTLGLAAQHLREDAKHVAQGQVLAEQLFWRPHPKAGRFRLYSDADHDDWPPQRWLVKRVIPDTGVGAIYGDSGTFKSFLALDLLAHISNGRDWFGYRVRAAPAVYVPFEGQGGIPNRVKAWRIAEHMRRNPNLLVSLAPPDDVRSNIAVIMDPMNLRDASDRDKLVLTLTEAGWAGGVLCIDTLAHASSGLDENSSAMAEMLTVFQDLQRRLGGVILLIHHSGKDQARGMRGWSGLHAAMDFVVECQRHKEANAFEAQFVLSKVKDGTTGTATKFAMSVVQLGLDDDGDYVTSLAVQPAPERAEGEVTMLGSKKGTIREIDAETASADDQFVWRWAAQQVLEGHHPSKNSLKGQLPDMKHSGYQITQDRVLAAIERLLAANRMVSEDKSANGNRWLRPVEVTPGSAEGPT